MKAIKISLAIVVIGVIAYFACKFYEGGMDDTPTIDIQEATEVSKIQNKIDAINSLPNSKFNKDIYDEILYLIDDKYKPHPPTYPFGRLGNTKLENDTQKNNLERNLYTAYVSKFLDQAFYVFSGTAWNVADLSFIRSEYLSLRSSPYIESGSPVNSEFKNIQIIFNKYDEINSFIDTCDSFSYLNFGYDRRYPVDEIRTMLDQFSAYRSFLVNHRYLKNCVRLQNKLSLVPQILFDKHVTYLDFKIDTWSGFYDNFNSKIMYRKSIYMPIKTDIDKLDSELYSPSVSTEGEYIRLLHKWEEEGNRAFDDIDTRNQLHDENK